MSAKKKSRKAGARLLNLAFGNQVLAKQFIDTAQLMEEKEHMTLGAAAVTINVPKDESAAKTECGNTRVHVGFDVTLSEGMDGRSDQGLQANYQVLEKLHEKLTELAAGIEKMRNKTRDELHRRNVEIPRERTP